MVVLLANAHSTSRSIYYQLTLLSDSNKKVAPAITAIQAVRLLALRINERTTAVFSGRLNSRRLKLEPD